MDLLGPNPAFDIFSTTFPIMSNSSTRPPAFVGKDATIDDSLIANGCQVYGTVKHSILSTDAYVGERATVVDSVLLPGAVVKDGANVVRAILGENSTVEENVSVGSVDTARTPPSSATTWLSGRGRTNHGKGHRPYYVQLLR